MKKSSTLGLFLVLMMLLSTSAWATNGDNLIGGGVAYTFRKLLIEADVKWINWGDADGHKDFDWDDQWVFGIGARFEPM